jgi:hypothetical protein
VILSFAPSLTPKDYSLDRCDIGTATGADPLTRLPTSSAIYSQNTSIYLSIWSVSSAARCSQFTIMYTDTYSETKKCDC